MIGLFLTALLTRFRVRGFLFFRTVLFMPQTIATVVVAQAFTWIYDPAGPLDEFLRTIGLGFMAKTWLGDFTWALPAVGLIGTWITFGLCLVLFLAGAQRIPTELYEAARVDGAGFLREFFAVTLPGLRNEIVVAATLTTITALRNFDIIYNTTSGGPGGETEVPSWLMFHNAFDLGRVGFAASIAVVLTIIITAVALAHRQPLEARRMTGTDRPLHDLRRADRVLAARDLPDDLDPLPGLPQEVAISSRASRCRRRSASQTFIDAWNEGGFAQGMWGSFLVATTVTAVSAVLSLFTGYAFGTMRFRGSGAALQPDRRRADLPLRGDGHPALLRLPQLPPGRHQPRGLVLGADPAADRAVGHARDVLDARVLPDARRRRWSRPAASTARARSGSCAASCCRRRGRRC